MNVLLIILIVLLIWRGICGLKNGFVDECTRLFMVLMALIVVSVLILLIAAVIEKNGIVTFVSGAVLVITLILYRLLDTFFKSIKTIAELPLLNLVNKLLGLAAGLVEVLAIFWIMYVIIGALPSSPAGIQIMEWTRESLPLQMIYEKNYIAHFISGLWR